MMTSRELYWALEVSEVQHVRWVKCSQSWWSVIGSDSKTKASRRTKHNDTSRQLEE